MALMSKPVAVTIPLTLILLDYMKGRKINKETLLEKWPFFIIAFILAVVTVIFQEPDWRIAQENYYPYFISKTIIFYLHKIIIPIKLSAIYPYHNVSPQHIAHIKYYILAIAIIVSIIAYSRKYTKVIMFGSLFFFITLVPTMRIIPVSYTFAADRYMYIPSIGIFYVCSFIFVKLYLYLRVRAKLLSYSLLSCLILWLTFLSIYTWNRSYVWRDSVTFYEEGIRSSPRYAPFYNNLGAAYRKNGEFEKSIGVLKRALELDPNLSGAWGHMGMVYLDLGKHGDALHALNKGLEICPNSDRMLYLKGLSYAKCNERKKAIEVWCKTIEINPACKEAYYSISLAYYHMNDYANSLKYMELARKHGAKIDTNFIEALLPHRRSNP